MPDVMTVSVTLTKHDLWQYFITAQKKRLVCFLVFYVIIMVSASYLLYSGSGEPNIPHLLIYLPIILAVTVLLAALVFLAPFFDYRRLVAECRDSKVLDRTALYRIGTAGYTVQTDQGQFSINWREIYKLVESRSQMIVYQSVAKVYIIPKRCFSDAGQLQAFIDLAAAAVGRKKLKRKHDGFSGFSPETAVFSPPAPPMEPVQPAVSPAEQPIMSVGVSLSKREAVNFNMYHYYSQPLGIVITLLGIVLLCYVGWLAATGGGTVFKPFVLGFLGVYLLIGTPVLIIIKASRMYKTDAFMKDTAITYHFYTNRIIVETNKGGETRYFGDFRRLKQNKEAYLLYLTRHLVYLIPKRFIADPAAFESYFQYMQSENARLKSANQ